MTTDEIFESFPEPSEEQKNDVKKFFTHYIFYEKHKNKCDYECEYCGYKWSYPQRTMTELDLFIMDSKYNDIVRCPHCAMFCIMKTRKKMGQSMFRNETKKVIFVIPNGYDEVYMRAYYVFHCPASPEYRFSETTRYYMTQGAAYAWKYIYDYAGLYGKANVYTWRLSKRIIQPFTIQGFSEAIEYWFYIGINSIEETYLKYSQYEDFFTVIEKNYISNEIDGDCYGSVIYKYLCLYSKYPQIEMLMKAEFYSIVHEALYQERMHKRYINWNAKKFTEFFGLKKEEISLLAKEMNYQSEILIKYKDAKKKDSNLKFEDFIFTYNFIGHDNAQMIDEVIKKYNMPLKRFRKYIMSQNQSISASIIEYRDYINLAEKLNYDLKNEVVLYPKNLKEKHDIAVSLYKANLQLINNQKMQKLTKKLYKKYHYENDEYIIKIPETISEIIKEGEVLEHCVGSYAERHANGKTVILFLRRKSEPDKPYFTIEMQDKDYRQIQGYKNKAVLSGTVKEFFDNFLEYVKHGNIKPAADQVLLMAAV